LTDAHELFTAYRDGVFRYLCRIVGRPETARDLTQEVFLRVSRARVPDGGEAGRRAWVFKIARNLALNHLRDEIRRPATVEPVDRLQPATQELALAIGEALADMPALDRDVFLMRETGGLGYDEIAAACELTTDAVRSRLHRARERLRAGLGESLRVHRERGIRLRLPERAEKNND
jgi:RNA polymerase sigma-70 factor (ECF subfamily)